MAILSPRKLTYEDLRRIPEDRQRHELLDGAHVVSPCPTFHHQCISIRLCARLQIFVETSGLGHVVAAPFDVILSEHDVVEPDVLFVAADRTAIIMESCVQGAPDLVVEVLSPSTRRRDLGAKLARYEKFGVPEYWVFEPDDSTVRVLRRKGDHFLPPIWLAAQNDDLLTTPLLPGLEISLRDVFAQ